MKEEELKKIISKSTVATSDDFVNHLMHRIDTEKELKKASFLGSFRSVFIACFILGLMTTFVSYKFFLGSEGIINVPNGPIFIGVTLILLFGINSIVKTNHKLLKAKQKKLTY